MRSIALDVHRDFCEVAIKDGGEVRSAGRIKTSAERARAVRPKPGVRRPGGARGERAGASDSARARAPRRPGGDRQHPQGAGDRRGEGKDRQGRRPDALRAAGGRVSARGLRPRRADPGAAAPARPPRRARPPAHPGKERAARGARPQPQGPPADERRLRGPRARVAGRRSRCPPTSARPSPAACARSTSSTARSRRSSACSPGSALASRGDPPADERAGGEPRLGGDLRRHGRRHRPLCDAAKARLLRRARSQGAPVRRGAGASRPDLQAGLGGRPPHALRGGLDRRSHAGPVARLL